MMPRSIAALFPTLALALLLASPASAREHTVCEDLKDATPGLYGLCIAYCEAQNCTTEEFDDMDCKPRKASVLRNYDRKRQAADPAMPCITQPEPSICPCFQRADLEQLELFVCRTSERDGVTTITANGPECEGDVWFDFVGASNGLVTGGTGVQNTCFIRDVNEESCEFQVAMPAPEDITQEQATACFELLQQYLADIGLNCP